MNRKQKICLWVGIALIVVMGLFPPWVLESEKKTEKYKESYTGPLGKANSTATIDTAPVDKIPPAATAEPPAKFQPKLTPDQFTPEQNRQIYYVVQQRRRMAAEGNKGSVKMPGSAVIDFQRPYFNSDEEYQQFVRTERVTEDLLKRTIAKQAEEQGFVLGYTREQQDQLASLEKARANLYASAGSHTPQQMYEMDEQIQLKMNNILPSWVPKPPTAQQEAEKNIVTLGSGTQLYRNPETSALQKIEGATTTNVVNAHEIRYITEPGPYCWIGAPPERAKFVDLYRLGIQYSVVAVAAVGLIITLRDKKDPKQ